MREGGTGRTLELDRVGVTTWVVLPFVNVDLVVRVFVEQLGRVSARVHYSRDDDTTAWNPPIMPTDPTRLLLLSLLSLWLVGPRWVGVCIDD